MPFTLKHIATCDSTNRAVLEYAPNTVLWADSQTKGRGRRGHSWESKKGDGLYFSIFLKEKAESSLPLLVSVAILKALESLGARDIFLKWPNDIFYKESKIGGVLVEQTPKGCVIGIGINLKTPKLENAEYAISSLSEIFENLPESEKIIAAILNEIAQCLAQGFEKNKDFWESHALWRGKNVQLTTESGIFAGNFCGVDFQGALHLSNFNQPFFSGSLRCPSSV